MYYPKKAHQTHRSNGSKNSIPLLTPNFHLKTNTCRISHFIGNKPETARRKLLVGLNMYGTLFTTQSPRRPITGTEYLQLLEKHNPSLQWDAESEESYFEFVDDTMQEGEVWYPSLYSIKKRMDLVDDYDVGGVSLWEVGQVHSRFSRWEMLMMCRDWNTFMSCYDGLGA